MKWKQWLECEWLKAMLSLPLVLLMMLGTPFAVLWLFFREGPRHVLLTLGLAALLLVLSVLTVSLFLALLPIAALGTLYSHLSRWLGRFSPRRFGSAISSAVCDYRSLSKILKEPKLGRWDKPML